MKLIRILAVMIIISSLTYSQSNQWINFFAQSWINCLVAEGQYLWIGTTTSLIKFNTLTGERESFDAKNSGLPDNEVFSVAIDRFGNKWIATGAGVAKYDNKNWTVYDVSNSGIPHNAMNSIAIDQEDNIWMGNLGELVKYDGQNWTVYNSSNSGFPELSWGNIFLILIDRQQNKWIAAGNRLIKYDDKTWTEYNTFNSIVTGAVDMAIDSEGNKWILSEAKIIKYDDKTWTVYDASGSGIKHSFRKIAIHSPLILLEIFGSEPTGHYQSSGKRG